jgi:predicted Zn-ribbon and HTH transcriptional regulator
MPEIQDILVRYADDYCQNHPVSYTQQKVTNALMECRTSPLGGHVTVCDECGHKQISYNLCRNCHCPKCQTLTKEKWIDNQKFSLLIVGYFHVVMTVPHSLHPVMLQNQEVYYNILFKAAAETLAERGPMLILPYITLVIKENFHNFRSSLTAMLSSGVKLLIQSP